MDSINYNNITRRDFIQRSSFAVAGTLLSSTLACSKTNSMSKTITINRVDSNFERETLKRPFGFKGSAMKQIWQPIAYLETDSGHSIGLGTQNPLWSDSHVFLQHTENGANALMYAMHERALQMLKGTQFTNPMDLLDPLLEEVYAYGKAITRHQELRKTFALNAMVAVDNALWLTYARENSIASFDQMIPEAYQSGLSAKHDKVASIPALTYGIPMDEIKRLADDGFFIMKIKIGAPGTQAEMLEKDKEFLKNIHETIGHYETPHTPDGKIPYYFDANGRYDKQETLMRFLDYAEEIGALQQIAVLEEPFGERNQESVHEIASRGPRVAADESAHTDEDSRNRIEQGYNAIALKAIAKTMSMTLKIAQLAYEKQVPCFCADLTVNPILVDWNKSVAARLPAFPGLNLGLQETNGWQNYRNWEQMKSYHPMKGAEWTETKKGVYQTGQEFFEKSGGIFEPSTHYEAIFS